MEDPFFTNPQYLFLINSLAEFGAFKKPACSPNRFASRDGGFDVLICHDTAYGLT